MQFYDESVSFDSGVRSFGYSVRLVTDVKVIIRKHKFLEADPQGSASFYSDIIVTEQGDTSEAQ